MVQKITKQKWACHKEPGKMDKETYSVETLGGKRRQGRLNQILIDQKEVLGSPGSRNLGF